MQSPTPIDQPTPYTCQHCGAGLMEQSEFCPRCGARMPNQTPRSVGYYVTLGLLVLGLLLFGGIGACSGVMVIGSIGTQQGEITFRGLLPMTAPLFLIGAAGFIWCLRVFIKKLS